MVPPLPAVTLKPLPCPDPEDPIEYVSVSPPVTENILSDIKAPEPPPAPAD